MLPTYLHSVPDCRVLARALKVGDGPICHIYRDMKLLARVAAAEKLSAALAPKAAPTPATTVRSALVSFDDQGHSPSQAGPSVAPGQPAAGAVGEDGHVAATGGEVGTELSMWDPPPRDELPHGKINDTRTFPQVSEWGIVLSLTIF